MTVPSMMLVTFGLLCIHAQFASAKYAPTWESLDARPIPQWYEDAKFGIFMHWGLYSVPSFTDGATWMWHRWRVDKRKDIVAFMKKNYKPGWTYADFANGFTAEFFDANRFAATIRDSGARYYVLTSKHHEGYTMWPSNSSWNWNAVDTGPHRNIVGELEKAFRSTAPAVRFGLYFSQYDWFHPLYMKDASNKYTTRSYPETVQTPQLHDIVNTFKPDVVWSDGDWDAPDTYWQSQQFLAWLYNESPVKDTVVTNDRWGRGALCHHGGFHTCGDKHNPGVLQKHKWENCMTVDANSWGFRRTAALKDILPFEKLLTQLVSTVSCGGNLLMNVGPTHDGRIIPIFEERLKQMGQWLRVNGQGIYGTKPWIYQNDTVNSDVWYTSVLKRASASEKQSMFNPQIEDRTTVYAIVLKWPMDGILKLGSPKFTPKTVVELIGYPSHGVTRQLKGGTSGDGGVAIDLRPVQWWKLPSTTAWVIRMRMLGADGYRPF